LASSPTCGCGEGRVYEHISILALVNFLMINLRADWCRHCPVVNLQVEDRRWLTAKRGKKLTSWWILLELTSSSVVAGLLRTGIRFIGRTSSILSPLTWMGFMDDSTIYLLVIRFYISVSLLTSFMIYGSVDISDVNEWPACVLQSLWVSSFSFGHWALLTSYLTRKFSGRYGARTLSTAFHYAPCIKIDDKKLWKEPWTFSVYYYMVLIGFQSIPGTIKFFTILDLDLLITKKFRTSRSWFFYADA
jgi:hypothetical protein